MPENHQTINQPPLVVSAEAMDAIKKVRQAAQKEFGMRPDVTLVATAMILAAASLPDLNNRIRDCALKIYAPRADGATS